jgi:hypothetical protein
LATNPIRSTFFYILSYWGDVVERVLPFYGLGQAPSDLIAYLPKGTSRSASTPGAPARSSKHQWSRTSGLGKQDRILGMITDDDHVIERLSNVRISSESFSLVLSLSENLLEYSYSFLILFMKPMVVRAQARHQRIISANILPDRCCRF